MITTITTLRFAKFKVRVWKEASPREFGPHPEITAMGRKLESSSKAGDIDSILLALSAVPGVRKIEILNPDGDGLFISQ